MQPVKFYIYGIQGQLSGDLAGEQEIKIRLGVIIRQSKEIFFCKIADVTAQHEIVRFGTF